MDFHGEVFLDSRFDNSDQQSNKNTLVHLCHENRGDLPITIKIGVRSWLIIFFKKISDQIRFVTTTLENTMIKPQNTARYLGVTFDKKLDWRIHTRRVEMKVASRIGLLKFLSRSTTNVNDQTMTNLYKTLVKSLLV